MSFQVYWTGQPSTIALDYYHRVTLEDLAQSTLKALRLMQQRENQRVYVLMDLSEIKSNPPNMMKSAAKIRPFVELLRHPDAAWFAIIKPDILTQFAIQLFFRHSAYRIFDDRQSALLFLEQMYRSENAGV